MVLGLGHVGGVGGFDAVDGAGVNNSSFLIDNEHLGRGFGAVLLADFAGGIEQDGGGSGVLILGVDIGLGTGAVALLAGGGRDDGEPDDALGGIFLLEFLHVAAGVMLFHERAFVIEPFEDDELAAETGKFVGSALGVVEGEVRGLLAGLDDGEGRKVEGKGDEREKEEKFHPINIPWNFGGSRMVGYSLRLG